MPMEEELRINQIKETCLYVADLARTEQFYAETLNLPLIGKSPGRHVFFRAGASVLLCFNSAITANDEHLPPHDGVGRLHFAWEVPSEQYDAWKKFITEKEIVIEKEVLWRKSIKSFYFRDPDKHLLEIVTPGLWG